MMALTAALVSSNAVGQQKSIKEQLIGTWTFVSAHDVKPDEGKAVAQGTISYYGTYTVNEADKTVTYRIEGSSYPNLTGGEQKRIITSLTADELRYTNPATTTGTKAEAVWKRAK
jgi:hypothetical protein